jgi:Toastrack DUF4097
MNSIKVTAVVWLAATVATLGATEQRLNKQFPAQPGGALVVKVEFGSIDVRPGAANEVSVDVWRRITRRTEALEKAYLRDHPVVFTQSEGVLTIRCKGKPEVQRWSFWSWIWGWHTRNRSEAKYVITVPARFNASLNTAGGAITVRGLSGTVGSHTSGGSLSFSALRGSLDGTTSGGRIQVEDCQGTLSVNTSGGSIDVTGGAGSLGGSTSGGSVTVRDFHGPARVSTSGGGITVESVTGAIDGSTSGGSIRAVLLAPVSHAVKLSTAGGGITVSIPQGAAFDLDAETSGGGVRSDLPVTVTGRIKRSQLKGPVNGGGKMVLLRTSGGSISVKGI